MEARRAELSQPSMRPAGRLARSFQDAYTVTVRLRTNRQVASDARAFRQHVKQLLFAADSDSRAAGYDPESVRQAVYALVAFLDESVLSSAQAMFDDWARQPLQEEVFGDHRAGEVFFERLDTLLAQQDSHEVADLLEVYLLCLLLGFRGRYGSGRSGELRSLASAAREKIARIRGDAGDLAPRWEPPADEEVPRLVDPWMRRLALAAIAAFGLAALLYVVYRFSLTPGVERVKELVG
jgi:type VI secretion system protein ImpK